MQNSIKLFNPDENVFGELSNNSKHKFDVDRHSWDSVTQYVYTNNVDSPIYKNILKNYPLKFIVSKSAYFAKTETDDAISRFLDEALSAKYKDERFANLLISTGIVPIIYISNNTYLGLNEKGEGLNLYGKKLMQLRAQLKSDKIQREKEEKENSLYKSYIAYKILKTEFENGSNLDKYSGGFSIDGIINKYGVDDEKKLNIPSKNIVMELINSNFELEDTLITSLKHPEILILKIKTPEELLRLRYKQELLRKNLIFNLYVDDMIRRNYSSLTEDKYKIAKQQQFLNLNYKKRDMFVDEVLRRYASLKLNSDLIEKINSSIKDIYIPTDTEIKIARENSKIIKKPEVKSSNDVVKEIFNDKEERVLLNSLHDELGVKDDKKMTWEEVKIENPKLANEIGEYVKTKKKSMLTEMINNMRYTFRKTPVKENKTLTIPSMDINNPFSLINPFMFSVHLSDGQDLKVPTISHYITVNLISKKLKLPIVEVYNKYMLTNPNVKPTNFKDFVGIDKLNEIYFRESFIINKQRLQNNAKIAIDKKFKDNKNLQDLLLSTGNSNIVWNDPEDNVLGVGENFVGKYLMELRREISKNRKDDKIEDNITDADIVKILENDHIQKWLIMKIKDVCKTIQFVKKFKRIKKISVETVQDILDKIYQPCSNLFNVSKDIEIVVPTYFKDIITNMGSDNYDERDKNMCSEELNDDEISTLLWKRIISILYIIVNNLNTSSDKDVTIIKILNTLYISQIVGSTNKNCIEIITKREDNCVVSAIVNLLQNILNFNRILNNNNIITKGDINLACSIIINFDITKIQQYNFFQKNKIDVIEDVDTLREFITEDQKYEVNELDEEYEAHDEDDSDKSDIDYEDESENESGGEEGGENESGGEEAYSAAKKSDVLTNYISINSIKYNDKDMKKLSFYLQENKISDIDHDNIARYILQCAVVIKNFKMPNNIKKNRINFFSK